MTIVQSRELSKRNGTWFHEHASVLSLNGDGAPNSLKATVYQVCFNTTSALIYDSDQLGKNFQVTFRILLNACPDTYPSNPNKDCN